MRHAREEMSGAQGGREGRSLGKGPVRPWNRRTEVRVTLRMSGEERARPGDSRAAATRETAVCTPTVAWPCAPWLDLWGRWWPRDPSFAENKTSSGGGMSQAAPGPKPSCHRPSIALPPVDDISGGRGWGGLVQQRGGPRAGVPSQPGRARLLPSQTKHLLHVSCRGPPRCLWHPPPRHHRSRAPGMATRCPAQSSCSGTPAPSLGSHSSGPHSFGVQRAPQPTPSASPGLAPCPMSVRSPFTMILCLHACSPRGD